MIKGQQRHADHRGQHERQSIHQQSGDDLLYGGDFEEAVDQFGAVRSSECRPVRARKPQCQVGHRACEQPLLDQFHDEHRQCLQRPHEAEEQQQHQRQDDDRLVERPEHDGPHQLLTCNRHRRRQQTDHQSQDEQDADVAELGTQHLPEAGQRRRMVCE